MIQNAGIVRTECGSQRECQYIVQHNGIRYDDVANSKWDAMISLTKRAKVLRRRVTEEPA